MLYGHLSAPDTYAHLLVNPTWKLAFDWLKTATETTPPGVQKLEGDDVTVNVHGYDTLPRDRCRFESHRRYVDLQYCISGGEVIDWCLASDLVSDGEYDSEKDVQFYRPPAFSTLPPAPRPPSSGSKLLSPHSSLLATPSFLTTPHFSLLSMFPGSFAIFHPSDAHRPKVRDDSNPHVFKLVIKIDRRLCR